MSRQNFYLLLHLKQLIYEPYEIWYGDKSDKQILHEAILCIKKYNGSDSVKL
jgi:hypothetical protein